MMNLADKLEFEHYGPEMMFYARSGIEPAEWSMSKQMKLQEALKEVVQLLADGLK
jgi:hypothetical protein